MSTRVTTGRNGLSPKQEAAALALASGATLAEAAAESGAGLTTVKVWLADCEAFPKRVAELRAFMTSEACGKLAASMAEAVDKLVELCRNAPSEVLQLRAAEAILTHGLRVREAVDLEQRLAAVEARHPHATAAAG